MSKKDTRLYSYGGAHSTLQFAQSVVRARTTSTLIEDQKDYVPPEDRIVIRDELHQWSLIDPVAYTAYQTALRRINAIEQKARVEVARVRRSIERMVERTRTAYPGE